jgi:hypothetical protein
LPLLEDDYHGATPLIQESAALFQEAGEHAVSEWERVGLAWLLLRDGRLDDAMSSLEHSLSVLKQAGARWLFVEVLWTAGHVARLRKDYHRGRPLLTEGLRLAQQAGYQTSLPYFLSGLAGVANQTGQLRYATRLYGAADLIGQNIGVPTVPWEVAETERDLTLIRAQLGEEAFAAAWAEGQAMTLEQAVAYALEETGSGLPPP